MIWAALLLFLPVCSHADFNASGDAQITGQVGAGTAVPQARLEVRMSPSDAYGLKVSSQNGDPLLVVDRLGRTGIGLESPAARLDVRGGDIGLQLRMGNSSAPATPSSQLIFASASSETFRHSIRTRHNPTQDIGNAIDFFLWQSTETPNLLGSTQVLSLEASTSAAACSVHARPVGEPIYELEVSSGSGITGGGIIRYGSAGAHSSRDLKTDVSYLDPPQRERAYQDIKSLRHARFRYKTMTRRGVVVEDSSHPLMTGLIFEDVPQSIRDSHGPLVVDYRLVNMELALQEVGRRITEVERKISALETKRGVK